MNPRVRTPPNDLSLLAEFLNGLHHALLILFCEVIVEGQPEQAVADILRHGTIPFFAAKSFVPFSRTISARSMNLTSLMIKRAAFTAPEALRLVKAQCRKLTERTKRLTSIRSEKAVRIVFNNRHPLPLRNVHDPIHLATDPRIVNRNDGLCAARHKTLEFCQALF